MRGKGCRHDPLVVRLVQGLVDAWVVQAAVDEIDEEVGEEEEDRELEKVVPGPWALSGCVVELGVAAALGDEASRGQNRHDGHGGVGLDHLKTDLVLEELGVCEGSMVEDEVVRGCRDDEIEEDTKEPVCQLVPDCCRDSEGDEPGYEKQGEELSPYIVAWPCTQVCGGARSEVHIGTRWHI